jgi:hypothetical protein
MKTGFLLKSTKYQYITAYGDRPVPFAEGKVTNYFKSRAAQEPNMVISSGNPV